MIPYHVCYWDSTAKQAVYLTEEEFNRIMSAGEFSQGDILVFHQAVKRFVVKEVWEDVE